MTYRFNIYFTATTINGIIIKNERVTPEMFNPHIFSQYKTIFINPLVFLKKEYISKSLGEDDVKVVFFNPPQFQNFIQRIKERINFKQINIKQAASKKIVDNNINFTLETLFKKNTLFVLRNRQYKINSFQWDGKYEISVGNEKKLPSINVNISIMLHEGKEMSFIESTRLTCLQRRQQIVNDYYLLVGLDPPKNRTAEYKDLPISREQQKKREEEEKKKNKK